MEKQSECQLIKFQIRRFKKDFVIGLKSMSVEPAGLLLMVAILMSYLTTQDLILEKACRVNLKYSDEVCDSIKKRIGNFSEEEAAIQALSSQLRIYGISVYHAVPIFFVLFMGPWTDIYGRKLPMILGLIGYLLQTIWLILCVYFESWDAYLVVLVPMIRTIFGTELGFSMAAFSYISDTTTLENRTIRTGILHACMQLGVPLGFTFAGLLSTLTFRYIYAYAIVGSLLLISLGIVLMTVKNVRNCGKVQNNRTNADCGESEDSKNLTCCQIVNPRNNVFNVLKLAFKQRGGNSRIKIWLLLIVTACVTAPIHGEFGITYLFLRYRLGWSAADYGLFSSYMWCMQILGVILSMGILSYTLKFSDPLVGFISGISQFSSCFIYAFATTGSVMYIAAAVDLMNSTMGVISKSMLSKIVDPTEIGKLFSLLSCAKSIVPLFMDPAYSAMYKATIKIFAGSFYFLSAALTIPPLIIYGWFIYKHSKEKESYKLNLGVRRKSRKMSHELSTDISIVNSVETMYSVSL